MDIHELRNKQGFISDMDGVIYHGDRLIPGADAFVAWLERSKKKYLFVTNSSQRSPRELSQQLERLGIQYRLARNTSILVRWPRRHFCKASVPLA